MNDSMDLRFLAARKKYIEGRFSMLNEMQRQAVLNPVRTAPMKPITRM